MTCKKLAASIFIILGLTSCASPEEKVGKESDACYKCVTNWWPGAGDVGTTSTCYSSNTNWWPGS